MRGRDEPPPGTRRRLPQSGAMAASRTVALIVATGLLGLAVSYGLAPLIVAVVLLAWAAFGRMAVGARAPKLDMDSPAPAGPDVGPPAKQPQVFVVTDVPERGSHLHEN